MTSKSDTIESLADLYSAHRGKVSFRWSSYLIAYERYLQPFRQSSCRLLEIGVQNGGSLEIWSKYLPQADALIGCDINSDCGELRFDDARIKVLVGNVSESETVQRLARLSPGFELIIDDGSHQSGDIIRAFCSLFGNLSDSGLYVIEDLHASYWQQYEGGLYDPLSAMAFFKRMADILNYEHWGISVPQSAPLNGFFNRYQTVIEDHVLATVYSIEFVNSMCFIRKKPADKNRLGKAVIVGTQEAVTADLIAHHDRDYFFAQGFQQHLNRFSTLPCPPEESYFSTLDEINKLKDRLAAQKNVFQSKLQEIERELALIHGSRSWRLTAPIRVAMRWIRELFRGRSAGN